MRVTLDRSSAGCADPCVNSLNERAVVFECAGEQCLGIVHDTIKVRPAVGVLVVVGGPQYRVGSHRQFVHLARHLAGRGFPVLRFDYRGMGDSGGQQRDFRAVALDIRVAIDTFLKSVPGMRSVVIFGLCDAASAALMYGCSDDRIAGMILANPWVRTESGLARAQVKHHYRGRITQGSFWRKLLSGRLDLLSTGLNFFQAVAVAMRRRGVDSCTGSDDDFVTAMRQGLERFTRPVLLLLSGRDLTAKEFTDLCAASTDWSRLIKRGSVAIRNMGDADHTFSTRAASEWASETCADWLASAVPAD